MDIILAVGPPVMCLVCSSPSSNVLSSISNSGDTVSSSQLVAVPVDTVSSSQLVVSSTVLVDIHVPCAKYEMNLHMTPS